VPELKVPEGLSRLHVSGGGELGEEPLHVDGLRCDDLESVVCAVRPGIGAESLREEALEELARLRPAPKPSPKP
jgi:hypothetical protein